jgi:fatty-acyl-CoA synthase
VTPTDTISAALANAATRDRGLRAIEYDGRSLLLPYATLAAESLRVAGALHHLGVKPRERVALIVPEVSDFVRAFFGIAAAGLVPVPMFPPAQAGDLPTFTRQSRHILAASRAAAVVTTSDVQPLLNVAGLPREPKVLVVRDLLDGPALTAPVSGSSKDIALLQFTSGSTAAPKGVVLTHANIRANVTAIGSAIAIGPDDVGVSWLPLYHDMGLIGMLLTALYSSVDAVVMSPVLFLKRPTAWLQAISDYGGTISFAPNFAYELCLRRVKPAQIGTLNLSSWRIAGCGAEPIRADTLTAFAEHFRAAQFNAASFVPSYGLAEHSLAVAVSPGGMKIDVVDAARLVNESVAVPAAGSRATMRLVGCGRPFPGHEVRIVDDNDRTLAERHVGRIVVRGPSVMSGYFEDPAASSETLRSGWLYTGDVGYLAGGILFVCGRTKDLIIRQGRKYHPPDIESAIADVGGVRPSGVVVFGVNRVEQADEVVAVLEARASSAAHDLVDHVRRRVRETAGLELDHVVVAPPGTIPRTTSGKVRRSETRARFQAGTLCTTGRAI